MVLLAGDVRETATILNGTGGDIDLSAQLCVVMGYLSSRPVSYADP